MVRNLEINDMGSEIELVLKRKKQDTTITSQIVVSHPRLKNG